MLKRGQVVLSRRGHDQGSFYVIVGQVGDQFLIADGKRRSLFRPKKKNPLHLSPVNDSIDLSEVSSDKKLRALLRKYNQRENVAI